MLAPMRLLPGLLRRGFVKVTASPDDIETLRYSIEAWRGYSAFRHPPVPPSKDDGTTFPRAFNVLFDLSRESLRQLDLEWQAFEGQSLCAVVAELPVGNVFLENQSKPFVGGVPASPFDASFFNLFNYDYGSLNAHVDRGLLTVVYGFSGTNVEETLRSKLWLREKSAQDSTENMWVDAEVECGPDEVLLFAGEQLEKLTKGRIQAIEHCVRVKLYMLPFSERGLEKCVLTLFFYVASR